MFLKRFLNMPTSTCRLFVARDSSIGISTRYGLDGPGVEFRCGRDFPHPSRPALGHPQPPTGSFLGVNRPGRGVEQPSPSSGGVEEKVELYLYTTSVFVASYRVTFSFTFIRRLFLPVSDGVSSVRGVTEF